MIIIMISGLAFAEDVPEGQECCVCAQDEAAFEQMLTEACQNGYNEQGIENPTEEQMNACITQVKVQTLENCPEQTIRAVEGDRDSDGVPDEEDNCPNIPNPLQAETDPKVKFDNKCRFIDNGDGTIADFQTDLEWLKDANSGGQMSWREANAYCERLGIAGGGWRLPSALDFELFSPPSGHPFMNVQEEAYWTMNVGSEVFGINFYIVCEVHGRCQPNLINSNYYVWPVRDMH
jgi:hypothetical protein